MASACVNYSPTTTTTTHINWLSPTTSLPHSDYNNNNNNQESADEDFNFQLGSCNPAVMLPADELFSDGKLLPLRDEQKASIAPLKESEKSTESDDNPCLFSPKAPRCSSRLREFLGLKKSNVISSLITTTSNTNGSKSIKQLLTRNTKTTSTSMSLPLLKDSEQDSSHDAANGPDELPRMSLDSNRPKRSSVSSGPKVRPIRPKKEVTTTNRGVVPIESPRMNPSGRVVFGSLERSSSCPSSFNGGLRYHKNNNHNHNNYKGVMERSYSGNVNVRINITPVLNVPVCSLRGGSSKFAFGNLFSSSSHQSQKKEGNNNIIGGNSYIKNYNNHTNSKIKDKLK